MHIWVLTDGKAGDLQSCLGVAERLGTIWTADAGTATIEQRVVDPKPPWLWLMPHGPISPLEKRGSQDDPLRPPYPDVAIASGRRAVPYLRSLKHRAPGCLTVFLKDPRTSRHGARNCWLTSGPTRPRTSQNFQSPDWPSCWGGRRAKRSIRRTIWQSSPQP